MDARAVHLPKAGEIQSVGTDATRPQFVELRRWVNTRRVAFFRSTVCCRSKMHKGLEAICLLAGWVRFDC
jgi:hypothetical protein